MKKIIAKLRSRNPAVLEGLSDEIRTWQKGEGLDEGRQRLAVALRQLDE